MKFKPSMNIVIDYYLIVTIDIYKAIHNGERYPDHETSISRVKPRFLNRFTVTEDEVEDPEYTKQHRKYTGILTAEELERVVREDELWINDVCQTMGSITDLGWLSSISWDYVDDYSRYHINAYVSPLIRSEGIDENFELLDDEQKEIVGRRVGRIIEKALKKLEQTDHYEDDFGFLKEAVIDFGQLELKL